MKTLQRKLWWLWAPLVFALQIYAQPDGTDKSPHKTGFPKASFPPWVDLQIPLAPTPVKADGKQCLVYELHITNFFTNDLELTRVEVFRDGTKAQRIASYSDAELASRIAHAGVPDRAAAERTIGPGRRAIMYLLLTVDSEADLPKVLRHRLFFKPTVISASDKEDVVEGAQVTVQKKAPLVLSAPLRGEGWVAARGLSNDSVHRRASVVIGKARIPQRFAIDFWRMDADGKPVSSPHRYVDGGLDFQDREDAKNANWHAYGAEVLAVANAVVADVKDGIPENEMGSDQKAVPITLETVAGNYVMLDLGKSDFALYAHLQPKSIRVRVGQKVRRGQVLGLLDNSGHSDAPHLHFHVTDGNSVLGTEGVPYVFEAFEVQGIMPSGELGRWKPPSTGKADKRRREIPIENAVVRFP